MVETKTTAPVVENVKGELTYEDKVIEKIVGLAIDSVDGLLGVDGGFFSNMRGKLVNSDSKTDGVNVEVGKRQVAVDLDIIAEYRKNVPKIFKDIKAIVESEVKTMTDLEVVEVNVNVVDIKTRAQYEADSVSVQERVTSSAKAAGEYTLTKYNQAVNGVKDATDSGDKEPRVI